MVFLAFPNQKTIKEIKPKKVERSSEDVFVQNGDFKIDFKTFISMVSGAQQTDDVRSANVQKIKELINSGQYSVDVQNIAKKMLDSMGE